MPIIDELETLRKLEEAGFTAKQAQVLVELQEHGHQRGFERFAEHLDRHMEQMEARMEQMEARLREQIVGVRTELHQEVGGLRTELHQGIGGLRSEMYRALHQQLFWFASMQTAIIAAVVLIVKLFL